MKNNTPMIINYVNYDRLLEMARMRIRERIDGIKSPEEMLKKKSNVLIVSEGAGYNTHVYCDGKKLRNVVSVEIDRIRADKFLTAKIEVLMPDLHLRAKTSFSQIK